MKVRDIMTANPRTAEPDTTLEEIATLMKDEDVGAIPVMEDGRVTGVVTDRDIVLRCIAEGKDATECTAEDIMTEGMKTIDPDADVDEAADLMAEAQVRRLAVVKGGKLVGMLSLGDIAVKTGDEEEESTAETLEEVSKGVKGEGRQASGRSQQAGFDKESEFEVVGSGARQQRGNGREEGRMQQARNGRGSQQPGVRGREERSPERSGRRQESRPQGRKQSTDRREEAGRERSRQQQGISNRSARSENARQQKVAPKRAEARGNRNAGRRRAS